MKRGRASFRCTRVQRSCFPSEVSPCSIRSASPSLTITLCLTATTTTERSHTHRACVFWWPPPQHTKRVVCEGGVSCLNRAKRSLWLQQSDLGSAQQGRAAPLNGQATVPPEGKADNTYLHIYQLSLCAAKISLTHLVYEGRSTWLPWFRSGWRT